MLWKYIWGIVWSSLGFSYLILDTLVEMQDAAHLSHVHSLPEKHAYPLGEVGHGRILNALIDEEHDEVEVQETSHEEQ